MNLILLTLENTTFITSKSIYFTIHLW